MDNKQTNKLNIPTELIDNMLSGVHSQDDLWGKNGIMTQLNKAILERILDTEMDFHLSNTENGRVKGNSRNGHGKKNVRSTWGEFELITPRDRHSTFEPQIIPKRTTRLDNLNDAILSLYARGMSVRDIQQTLQELYHFDVSSALISQVTDAVNLEVEQWRDRPLEPLYPVVWLDGISVKVRQDHQILRKTIYLALGINMEGYKELLTYLGSEVGSL